MPGLQRARRRLRPRVAADRSPSRRRRLVRLGTEDLDVVRHDGRTGASCWPARRRARRSSRASRSSSCRCRIPAIEVRPIAAMLGPHHLNEVFFDDLWVTDADVLGEVGEGWKVVQEVLAFERVGIARYARCRAAAHARPTVLGDDWETLPEELRARWVGMLTHCRRARLLAYRVVGLQQTGRVTPGDTAAYRIAVTLLDQSSASVLIEMVGLARLEGDEAHDSSSARWRITGGTRRRPPSPRAASRSSASCWPGPSRRHDHRAERRSNRVRRHALRAFEAAGGDDLALARLRRTRRPCRADRTRARRVGRVGARSAWRRRTRPKPQLRCAAAPGYWAVPYPVAERLAPSHRRRVRRPSSWSIAPRRPRRSPGSRCGGSAVDVDGRRSTVTPRLDATTPRKDLLVVPTRPRAARRRRCRRS